MDRIRRVAHGDIDSPAGLAFGSRARPAYTLLEVILALALTIVVFGLVGLAMHIQAGVASKSRAQVEEAQLARVLLQRMADDLRNAVPFVPARSSDLLGLAESMGISELLGASESSDDSSTDDSAPLSGGLFGTAQALQVETCHRPRATPLLVAAAEFGEPARLSDLRCVTYSLGLPGSSDLSQEAASSALGTGLFRREQERSEFVYASHNGQIDDPDETTEMLAPEVIDVQFTYFDGTTACSEWDSSTSGKLPTAVRISISIRRAGSTSMFGFNDPEAPEGAVYSMLVTMPNAKVSETGQ